MFTPRPNLSGRGDSRGTEGHVEADGLLLYWSGGRG